MHNILNIPGYVLKLGFISQQRIRKMYKYDQKVLQKVKEAYQKPLEKELTDAETQNIIIYSLEALSFLKHLYIKYNNKTSNKSN